MLERFDCYFYRGEINDQFCLKHKTTKKEALLTLYTFGGNPHQAYRFVSKLKRCYNNFVLYVPSFCKSAGTIVAIGAHELWMSSDGELGPLDIQIQNLKKDATVERESGLEVFQTINYLRTEFLRTIVEFMEFGSKWNLPFSELVDAGTKVASGFYQQMIQKIEVKALGRHERALSIVEKYAEVLDLTNIKEAAVQKLIRDYPDHGFCIDLYHAKTIFEKVENVDDILKQEEIEFLNTEIEKLREDKKVEKLIKKDYFLSTKTEKHLKKTPISIK